MIDDTLDIMDKGFDCFTERLGIINAERFIAMIKREDFDYMNWRRGYFDDMSLDEVSHEAVSYAKKHPYTGNGICI